MLTSCAARSSFSSSPPPAFATDIFDVRVQKVADGVYVASRAEPLRPYVEGNVTLIINEHDVVVVDAGGSPRIARNIIAELRKLTKNRVSTLVYTHIHRDHRFGTQEWVKAVSGDRDHRPPARARGDRLR